MSAIQLSTYTSYRLGVGGGVGGGGGWNTYVTVDPSAPTRKSKLDL